MPLFQVVVLAVVQGITEFLPISSTAHLALIPWLFHWQDPGLTFDVALHVGTLAAVLSYFYQTWVNLILLGFGGKPLGGSTQMALSNGLQARDPAQLLRTAAKRTRKQSPRKQGIDPPQGSADDRTSKTDADTDLNRAMLWFLAAATVPAAVAGWLFQKQAESNWRQPVVIASALILVAIVMALGERVGRQQKDMRSVSLADSLWIGFSQALALIPGVSRSGITITCGLFRNLRRETAARFSFLLVTPIIAGAALKEFMEFPHHQVPPPMRTPFLVGVLVSTIVGYATISFFLKFLQFGTFRIFIYYRVIFGIIVLALAFFFHLRTSFETAKTGRLSALTVHRSVLMHKSRVRPPITSTIQRSLYRR